MATSLKIIGFIFSFLPYSFLEAITVFLGEALMILPNKRKRIISSNLKHAFPGWSDREIRKLGSESAAQMCEMGFFSLAYPFLSRFERATAVFINNSTNRQLDEFRKQGKPVIFLLPHVSLFETLIVSQEFRPSKSFRLGAIYRPNRNPILDQWIRESRISNGMKLFSRENALFEAKQFLRQGNWLVLLFDQHSGIQGCHSYFLNRFASLSTLPGLLAKAANATVVFTFPQRTSFFKTSLQLTTLSCPPNETPFAAHKKLEELIRSSGGLPEWLWAHERWKTQQNFRFHLRHRHKRENLPLTIPRTTKIFVRMPNWLGDVVMTFPLLDAIRRGRPDSSLTLLAKPAYEELLLNLGLADQFIALPQEFSKSSYMEFLENRNEYPSLIINFANSLRSDIECFALGCPRRYGLVLPGRSRPLLTHSWRPPHSHTEDDKEIHQVRLWEQMLQHFGLEQELDVSPIKLGLKRLPAKIGIMPGSANNPSKRWPLGNWRELVERLLAYEEDIEVNVFGATQEVSLAKSIVSGFAEKCLVNQCGKTNLWNLATELASCSAVIGNDSGGMHLANAVGTPTCVLFGPTNSKVTAPCFNVPLKIIQAKETSNDKTSEQILERLSVTEVLEGINALG